jgi:FG-GAP repeat
MLVRTNISGARVALLLVTIAGLATLIAGALRAGGSAGAGRQARPAAVSASEAAVSRALGSSTRSFWARATPGGFAAANARQGLAMRFTARGVQVAAPGGSVALRLAGIGSGDVLRPAAAVAPSAAQNRVAYRRGEGITEWYANGPFGLEQGLTLARPAAAGGALRFTFAVAGGLLPRLVGGSVIFSKPGGSAPVLSYGGLTATDATGRLLPARIGLAGDRLSITVDDRGARYPVLVDPTLESGELTATDSTSTDQFGYAVAQSTSGSLVVVGAPNAKVNGVQTGAAYVFMKPSSGWANAHQTAKLAPADGACCDSFGRSVAVVGTTVVVGAPFHKVGANGSQGAVYVYSKPTSSSATPVELTSTPGTAGEEFGSALAASGTQLFVGAPGARSYAGSVFEFTEPATGWTAPVPQTATLTPSDTTSSFGQVLAASSDTLVVGSPYSEVGSNLYQGAGYVYVAGSGGWKDATETAKLTASDGAQYDQLATSAAVYASTGTIALGAPGHAGGGAVYVYQEPAAGWRSTTQSAEMTKAGAAAGTGLGKTVAITDAAGTGVPTPPFAKAQTGGGTPSAKDWGIGVLGGTSNGSGLTVFDGSSGWANQTTGASVTLPVYGSAASPYAVDLGPGGMAIANNSGNGSVVVIPQKGICSMKSAQSLKHLERPALNQLYCDDHGFFYFASTALNGLQTIAGGVLVTGGVVAVGAGTLGEFPSFGGTTLAIIGGGAAADLGANMIRGASASQTDPPDPHFHTLFAVRHAHDIRAPGLHGKAKTAFDAYVNQLNATGSVLSTLTTTIDRAGGALNAGNTAAVGMQMRYALTLVTQFDADVAKALSDARTLTSAARHTALTATIPSKDIKSADKQVLAHGYPASVAKILKKYGLATSLAHSTVKSAKKPKHLATTTLAAVAGSSVQSMLRQGVKAFNAWAADPQVISEAELY